MMVPEEIRNTVKQCEYAISMLENMASGEPNPIARKMLKEGAHHLRDSIQKCQYALAEMQAPIWT